MHVLCDSLVAGLISGALDGVDVASSMTRGLKGAQLSLVSSQAVPATLTRQAVSGEATVQPAVYRLQDVQCQTA